MSKSQVRTEVDFPTTSSAANGETAAAYGSVDFPTQSSTHPPLITQASEVLSDVVTCNEESSLVRKERTYTAHTEPVPSVRIVDGPRKTRCWQKKKFRDNWQTFFGAISLILVGIGALCGGIFLQFYEGGGAGVMLYIFSALCIIPGGYYTGVTVILWTRRDRQ